jgi:hypothetical protein
MSEGGELQRQGGEGKRRTLDDLNVFPFALWERKEDRPQMLRHIRGKGDVLLIEEILRGLWRERRKEGSDRSPKNERETYRSEDEGESDVEI